MNNLFTEYSDGFHDLLKRRPTDEYIQEWTEAIRQEEEKKQEMHNYESYVFFRLGNEWLAIQTNYFVGVIPSRPIHKLPHRKGVIIKGIVNLDGEIVHCINMHALLNIQPVSIDKKTIMGRDRMIAISQDNFRCVFPVDEVKGIFSLNSNLYKNIPLTLFSSVTNFLKKIFPLEGMNVGLVDEELVFSKLRGAEE